jgi:hypothetical protein
MVKNVAVALTKHTVEKQTKIKKQIGMVGGEKTS